MWLSFDIARIPNWIALRARRSWRHDRQIAVWCRERQNSRRGPRR